MDLQHVFFIGSKGIPAGYGGYETFLDGLTKLKKNNGLRYHVACLKTADNNEPDDFEYNGAHCHNFKLRTKGPQKAVFYDIEALKYFIAYTKQHNIEHPIFYICACRIGPFIAGYKKQISALGGILMVNPDGQEWKRGKWNFLIRKYWRFSERYMVKNADLLVCDNRNVEKYIKADYKKYTPKTTYIAYGADTNKSVFSDDDPKVAEWYSRHKIKPGEYYVTVGRLVPENNFVIMLQEFMKSDSKKDLVLIADVSDKYFEKLKSSVDFGSDPRIKFVGTVYDQQLLKKIRQNAYAYIHGHSVGGTNPSLLEALGLTKINLLFDVSFNREVGGDGALYWTKDEGSLAKLIDAADTFSGEQREELGIKARQRIIDDYSWEYIRDRNEELFLNCF